MQALFEKAPPTMLTVYFLGNYPFFIPFKSYYTLNGQPVGKKPDLLKLHPYEIFIPQNFFINKDSKEKDALIENLRRFCERAVNNDFNADSDEIINNHMDGYKIQRKDGDVFLYNKKNGYKIKCSPDSLPTLVSIGPTKTHTEDLDDADTVELDPLSLNEGVENDNNYDPTGAHESEEESPVNPFASNYKTGHPAMEPVPVEAASATSAKRVLNIRFEKKSNEYFNNQNILVGEKLFDLKDYFEKQGFAVELLENNVLALSREGFSITINPTTRIIRLEGPEFTEENKEHEANMLMKMVAACEKLKFQPLELEIEGVGLVTPVFSSAIFNRHNRELEESFVLAKNNFEKLDEDHLRLVEEFTFLENIDQDGRIESDKYRIDFSAADKKIKIYRTTETLDEAAETKILNKARREVARVCHDSGLTILPPVPAPSLYERTSTAVSSAVSSAYSSVRGWFGSSATAEPVAPTARPDTRKDSDDEDGLDNPFATGFSRSADDPLRPYGAPAQPKSAWSKIVDRLPKPIREISISKLLEKIRPATNTEGNTAFQIAFTFQEGPTAAEIRSLLYRLSSDDLSHLNDQLYLMGFELKRIRHHYYLVNTENQSRIALTKMNNEFTWTTQEKHISNDNVDNALKAMLTLYFQLTPTETVQSVTNNLNVVPTHGDEARHYEAVKDEATDEVKLVPKDEIGDEMEGMKKAVYARAESIYNSLRPLPGRSFPNRIREETVKVDQVKDLGLVLSSEILERDYIYDYIQKTLEETPNAFNFDKGEFVFTRDKKDGAKFHLRATGVDLTVDLRKHQIISNKLNDSASLTLAYRGMMLLNNIFSSPDASNIRVRYPKTADRDLKNHVEGQLLSDEADKYLNATVIFNKKRNRLMYVRVGGTWYKNGTADDSLMTELEQLPGFPGEAAIQNLPYYGFNLELDENLTTPAEKTDDIQFKALEAMNREHLLFGTRGEIKGGSEIDNYIEKNRDLIDKKLEKSGGEFMLCGTKQEGYYLFNPNSETGHKIHFDSKGKANSEFYKGSKDDLEKLIQALVNNHIAQLLMYKSLPEDLMRGKEVQFSTTIPAQAHSAQAKADYDFVSLEVKKRFEQVVQEKFSDLAFTVKCNEKPVEAGFSGATTDLPRKVSPMVPKKNPPSSDPSAQITFAA